MSNVIVGLLMLFVQGQEPQIAVARFSSMEECMANRAEMKALVAEQDPSAHVEIACIPESAWGKQEA